MISLLRSVLTSLVNAFWAVRWREPIRALGAVIAVATVLVDILSDAEVADWQAAVPVLLAEVFRRLVFSPETHMEEISAAFDAGTNFAGPIVWDETPDDPRGA